MRREVLHLGIVLLLALAGCSGTAGSANAIPLAEASVKPGEFFPRALYTQPAGCSSSGAFSSAKPRMTLAAFEQQWFSSHLAAAGEQPLVQLAPGKTELFRFTWLRSFDQPVVIRIEAAKDGRHRFVATRLSGAGGYQPGAVAGKIDRPLSDDEWKRIQTVISRSRVLEQMPGECQVGLDGSEWIVEAIDGNGYHFLKRGTPQKGPVREFGLLLLKMTGWKFKEIY